MGWVHFTGDMNHLIEHRPAFRCIGLEAVGSLSSTHEWIPRLWSEFWHRRAEIGIRAPCGAWGLMSDAEVHLAPWGGERGRYLACIEAADTTEEFGDWKVWIIPQMAWMRIPCAMRDIPEAVRFAKEFQRNHPEWRWGGAVHEFYPAGFRDPRVDQVHLMAGLLPR